MKQYKYLLILLICLFAAGSACTPPTRIHKSNKKSKNIHSTSSNSQNAQKAENTEKNQSMDNIELISKTTKKHRKKNKPFENRKKLLKDITSDKDRFVDTTYYFLFMEDGETKVGLGSPRAGENIVEHRKKLILNFNNAIEDLDKEKISNCNIFKYFADEFKFNDSLQQEAIFYSAECDIMNNKLDEALSNLHSLAETKMNRAIAPKVLVRIGQLYCVLGDKEEAAKFFKKLKKSFPKSIYNKLADCSRF